MAVQERARGVQVNNVATPADVIFDNTSGADINNLVLKIVNPGAAAVEAEIYIRDNAAAAVTDAEREDQAVVPIGGTKYMAVPVLVDDDHILGLVDVDEVRVTVYEVDP